MFSMTIENIKIEETIERVRVLLAAEKNISPALKAAIEVIILALTLVCNRLGINSSNSSKSPSQDPNRKKGKNVMEKSREAKMVIQEKAWRRWMILMRR